MSGSSVLVLGGSQSVLTAGAIRVVCFRKNGQDRRGDGSNKQRHEGSRKELDRDGKMLWDLCIAV